MTSRFYRSTMSRRKVSFTVQIGSYSKYICKGHYTSPEFGNEDRESNRWSLLVHVYDGADHENFIDVRLRREDGSEEQIVKVETSIVNAFGFKSVEKKKEISFRYLNEAQILSMAKEELKGCLGLKKHFYLPQDTLTLKCDLVEYENHVSSYTNTNQSVFQYNIPNVQERFPEYFTHSRLVEAGSDFFIWEIRDFSIYACGGRSDGPEYQSGRLGGKWNLIVCSSTNDYSAEFIDIRIMRRESHEHQLIKVKLSVIDYEGKTVLSKDKNVYFTSSRDVQLLSFPKNDISGWFGRKRDELMPNDTLTLRCEMVLCEEVNDNFSNETDFDRSVKTHGYSPIQSLPYLPFICVALFVMLHMLYKLCIAVLFMLYTLCIDVRSFIWYTILDFIEVAKVFLICVVVIVVLFQYIRYRAEKIERKKRYDWIRRMLKEETMRREYNELIQYGSHDYPRKQSYANRKPKYYIEY